MVTELLSAEEWQPALLTATANVHFNLSEKGVHYDIALQLLVSWILLVITSHQHEVHPFSKLPVMCHTGFKHVKGYRPVPGFLLPSLPGPWAPRWASPTARGLAAVLQGGEGRVALGTGKWLMPALAGYLWETRASNHCRSEGGEKNVCCHGNSLAL